MKHIILFLSIAAGWVSAQVTCVETTVSLSVKGSDGETYSVAPHQTYQVPSQLPQDVADQLIADDCAIPCAAPPIDPAVLECLEEIKKLLTVLEETVSAEGDETQAALAEILTCFEELKKLTETLNQTIIDESNEQEALLSALQACLEDLKKGQAETIDILKAMNECLEDLKDIGEKTVEAIVTEGDQTQLALAAILAELLEKSGEVVIDCDDNTQTETFDNDVRIVGAKNPLPVYQIAQCGEYLRTEDVKLCEVDAEFLLLIDSGGTFARYSFITGEWEEVTTLSVNSAGGSADVENFRLYNFVAPNQLTVIDVNTDTQLPNITLVDGVINPAVTTNPKTFSAASFRDADGFLYAQDTAGADAGLYKIDVGAGTVDFVTVISGVSGAGTSIAIDNTTDTLIVNGTNISDEVDWVTGVGTNWGNPPIQPNGSTFDTAGNFYVTEGDNTYMLPVGADPNDPSAYVQLIDDFSAGANSIAYYRVEAKKPSCFFRRYGILENGDREVIGDFNVTDDSPRTIVGEVDCCEAVYVSDSGGSPGAVSGVSLTPNRVITTSNGATNTGIYSFTIHNHSETITATVGGSPLPPGETVSFSAPYPNTLSSMSYVTNGAELHINYID